MRRPYAVMARLQAVVPTIAKSCDRQMRNGEPAFQLVMSGMVQPVGQSDRNACGGCLQGGETGGIIHHLVGQQNLFPPPSLKVSGGSIVKASKRCDAGE